MNCACAVALIALRFGFHDPFLKYAIAWVIVKLNINAFTFVVAEGSFHHYLTRPSTNRAGRVW